MILRNNWSPWLPPTIIIITAARSGNGDRPKRLRPQNQRLMLLLVVVSPWSISAAPIIIIITVATMPWHHHHRRQYHLHHRMMMSLWVIRHVNNSKNISMDYTIVVVDGINYPLLWYNNNHRMIIMGLVEVVIIMGILIIIIKGAHCNLITAATTVEHNKGQHDASSTFTIPTMAPPPPTIATQTIWIHQIIIIPKDP